MFFNYIMVYKKSKKLSQKHRKMKKTRTHKTKHRRIHKLRGGSGSLPFVGSPYNAGDLNPSGNFLPISKYGIPASYLDPARQSNEILYENQNGGMAFGRGGKGGPYGRGGKGSSYGRGGSKRSGSKRSGSKRSGSKRSGSMRRRKGNKRTAKQRGGGLSSYISTILPEDVVNAGRSVPAAFGHLADRFSGLVSSPSSFVYPTQQPLVAQVQPTNAITPPDIKAIYASAANTVNSI